MRLLGSSLATGLVTLAIMLATEPLLVIGWDEGYTLGREARVRDWFHGLRDPARFAATWHPLGSFDDLLQNDGTRIPRADEIDTRAKLLFERGPLDWFWPFARGEPHGHPPFYALLGLVGDLIVPAWAELPRARLGPILLFSLTAGAIFHFFAASRGPWPAVAAAVAWVFQPNLFAHGHYAAYDAVLSSLWVLAILVFIRAVTGDPEKGVTWRTVGWSVLFGVLVGCAAGTKLTGWFMPLPFAAWASLYQSRRAATVLAIGAIVAAVTLFAQMPPWWTQPVLGLLTFFESNLTREATRRIPVEFLGTIYDSPRESLPWYNTLAWTVMVTPVGLLLLGCAGLWAAARQWRSYPTGILIAANWVFLMLLRALPHTPGHDGVRLFLPAFGVLALLVGVGVTWLIERWKVLTRAVVVVALMEAVASVAIMMPVPASYFSPLVGGLPGASALGMEPTYYWDALTPDARRWLTRNTPIGKTMHFASNPHSWFYLRRTGDLPKRLYPIDPSPRAPDRPVWYILQNRPGAFEPWDRKLAREGRPAYVVTKLGVPLIWVFPHSELDRLMVPSESRLGL
jgi:hypothetical protein